MLLRSCFQHMYPSSLSCGHGYLLTFKNVMQPLIIAVEENETVLNDTPESLGIEAVRGSLACLAAPR